MKLKLILNIIKLLKSSKDFIIYSISSDNNINPIYSSDNIDNDTLALIFNDIKENLINKLGNEKYGEKLELYDKDLFNAYKEADYQMLKADYFESAYEYYTQVNDPIGGDANKLYLLYKRLLQTRDKYEKYLMQIENEK